MYDSAVLPNGPSATGFPFLKCLDIENEELDFSQKVLLILKQKDLKCFTLLGKVLVCIFKRICFTDCSIVESSFTI